MPVKTKQQNGFTLIEIMIAMLLGIIVVTSVFSIYISSIRGSTDITNSARLNYDLDSVTQLMTNDIKRAGYWSQANTGSDAKQNIFTIGNANIIIAEKTGETANSCILYTYEGETANDTVDTNEYYGFRLNGTGIDMRFSVNNIANATCNDGNWENIINTNKVTITTLTFSNANYKCLNLTTGVAYNTPCASVTTANLATGANAVETRQIDIAIQGNVVGDTPVTKSLASIVKIRNDRIFTQP